MHNRRFTALDYLKLIAEGYTVIESSGSFGQMTLQAPDDWEFQDGDKPEYVVDFSNLTDSEGIDSEGMFF